MEHEASRSYQPSNTGIAAYYQADGLALRLPRVPSTHHLHGESPAEEVQSNLHSIVWKFQDFSVTLFFREINFRESRSVKSAVFTYLEALNFDIYEFLHF